jgi:hypothetical protein
MGMWIEAKEWVQIMNETAFEKPSSKTYPCNKSRIDHGQLEFLCRRPSAHYALGNDARYGHLCEDCWAAEPPSERALYAVLTEDRAQP